MNSPRKYKKGPVLCFPRDKLSHKSDKFLLTLIGFHLCKKFSFLCSFVSGVRGGAKHFCRANLSAMWFLQDTTGPKLAVVYCSTKNKTLQIFQQTAALRGSKPNSRFKEIFSFFFVFLRGLSSHLRPAGPWTKGSFQSSHFCSRLRALIYGIFVVLGSDHSDGKWMDISSAAPCQFLCHRSCPIWSRIHGITPSAALEKFSLSLLLNPRRVNSTPRPEGVFHLKPVTGEIWTLLGATVVQKYENSWKTPRKWG